jgi:hypothetical protein
MQGMGWDGLEETEKMWDENFKTRAIVSKFLKDGALGKKRLASMPDRVSNTINTLDEGQVFRPTVINCYDGDLGSVAAWWPQWTEFMFQKEISTMTKKGPAKTKISAMLLKIKKSKYPDITEEEERISIPLQTLAAAIFDSILVHIVNKVSQSW